MRRFAGLVIGLLIFVETGFAQQATVPFSFTGGGFVFGTDGASASAAVGYSRVQSSGSGGNPAGLEIFGYRQNEVLISEAAVPATSTIVRGRIYAEIGGPVNTGIAIANPNADTAVISYTLNGTNGQLVAGGSFPLSPNSQIARFLDQLPFAGQAPFRGTFSFTSTRPIAAIALRGFTNERNEFLITTLPVADLNAPSTAPVIFPHYADGGGWTTQIILVNPTDTSLDGTIQFRGPVNLASLEGLTVTTQFNTFRYGLPAKGAVVLQTLGTAAATSSGWISVIPSANNAAPSGTAVFSYKQANVTVTQAGVPMLEVGRAFRIYSETGGDTGDPGSVLTGVAVANPSLLESITVNFELLSLTGESTGLTGSLNLAPSGQTAAFLNQIKGFENLRGPFQGILRVSTPQVSGMAVVGLRGRYNERNEFLIATTAPIAESGTVPNAELFFPHVVDGGGYTSQFVLFGRTAGQASSGSVTFSSQAGAALPLNLTGVGVTSKIGAAGGTLSNSFGDQAVFPPNVLPAGTNVTLTSLTRGTFESPIGYQLDGYGLSFLRGMAVQTGVAAGFRSAIQLSIANKGALADDAQILIAQLVSGISVDGKPGLVVRDAGVVNGANIDSLSGLPFTGIRNDGQFVFLRATSPLALLSGKLTDSAGGPIANATVMSLGMPQIAALSDANGQYVLPVPASGASATLLAQNPATKLFDMWGVTFPSAITSVSGKTAAIGAATPPLWTRTLPLPTVPLQGRLSAQQARQVVTDLAFCGSQNKDVVDLLKRLIEELKPKVKDEAKGIPVIPPSVNFVRPFSSTVVRSALKPIIDEALERQLTIPRETEVKIGAVSYKIRLLHLRFRQVVTNPSAKITPAGFVSATGQVAADGTFSGTVTASRDGNGSVEWGPAAFTLTMDADYSLTAEGKQECPGQVDGLKQSLNMNWEGDAATFGPMAVTASGFDVVPPTAPVIALSTSTLSFAATKGGSNPNPQTFSIRNAGAGNAALNPRVSTNVSWLTVSPDARSLLPGELQALTVSVNIAGLDANTYTGTITVADPNASNRSVPLTVTLVVSAAASNAVTRVQISPDSLTGFLNPGATVQFTATAYDASGRVVTNAKCEFTVFNPVGSVVATINSTTGLLTVGNASGAARVIATCDGVASTNSVLVSGNGTTQGSTTQFDGSYSGTYSGSATVAGLTVPVSGAVVFSIQNGSLTMTQPGFGRGTVAANGTAQFGITGGVDVEGAACTYTATFSVTGGISSGTGDWSCTLDGGSARGTWNARRQ